VGVLDTILYPQVPVTGTPETYWQATCVRTGYLASESARSNTATDNGALPPIYLEPVARGGAGFPVRTFTTTDRPPIKQLLTDAGTITRAGSGFAVVRWALNGQDVLNP
jgi:hypothetical protein